MTYLPDAPGTITLTNNSNALGGTGTGFTFLREGDGLVTENGTVVQLGADPSDDNAGLLATTFKGPTETNVTYSVVPRADGANVALEARKLVAANRATTVLATSSAWAFSTGVNDADPGAGYMRFNNTTPGIANKVILSDIDANGNDLGEVLDALTGGSRLVVRSAERPNKLLVFVIGAVTDNASWHTLTGVVEAVTTGLDLQGDEALAVVPAHAGGDGLNSVVAGASIGVNVSDPLNPVVSVTDAELAAIAGLTSAADKLPYFTGAGAAALAAFTAAARTLVASADAATMRAVIGAVAKIGDTMTGTLNMNANLSFEDGDHRISYNDGGGNFNFRVGHYHDIGSGVAKYSDDGAGAMHMEIGHENPTPYLRFRLAPATGAVAGAGITWATDLTFDISGKLTIAGVTASGWEELANAAYSGAVANIDVTDLANYRDLKVIVRQATWSGNSKLIMQTSVDNGANFATTGYLSQANHTSFDANVTSHITLNGGVDPECEQAVIMVEDFNKNRPSIFHGIAHAGTAASACVGRAPSGINNALRIAIASGTNFTGYNVIVYGRR